MPQYPRVWPRSKLGWRCDLVACTVWSLVLSTNCELQRNPMTMQVWNYVIGGWLSSSAWSIHRWRQIQVLIFLREESDRNWLSHEIVSDQNAVCCLCFTLGVLMDSTGNCIHICMIGFQEPIYLAIAVLAKYSCKIEKLKVFMPTTQFLVSLGKKPESLGSYKIVTGM